MPPPTHFDIDIEADANPLNPPKVVVRGAPAGTHPALNHKNGDTVQWHNHLPAEDISIAIPWGKRALTKASSTIELLAGDDSDVFAVKPAVSSNYIATLRYLVMAEGSGKYAIANSDPTIEIK